MECNGDSLSVAVPSKVKKRYSSVTNSLSVTLIADGCVNIKFAKYLMGNRPLTCKRIILQRDSGPPNTGTTFHVIQLKAQIRDS